MTIMTVGLLALTSIHCNKKEPKQASDALNNAADATKNVLREVAEGINDAVYKK